MYLQKTKMALAFSVLAGFSGLSHAASSELNVSAKVYIERGTCTFKVSGATATSIIFDFNNITPADVEAKSKFVEKRIDFSDCIGTSKIKVSMSSLNTVKIPGDTTNNYLRPADSAVKVAYKTEVRTANGTWDQLYVGATGISLLGNFDPFGKGKNGEMTIRATLISAVVDIMTIGSGSLDSTATLNMEFL